jgi:long-chain acyl-CoA synthetase
MPGLLDQVRFNRIYFNGTAFRENDLVPEIRRLSGFFRAHARGDSPFIYLFAPNHVKTVIAYFAILEAGFIAVLIDPFVKRFELEECLIDTPPAALVRIDPRTPSFDPEREVEFRKESPAPGAGSDLENVCTLVYTAAEDGFYKGVMLTRKNLLSNARAIIDGNGMGKGSLSFAVLPFNHVFGLQAGLLAPALAGESILIEDISDLRRVRRYIRCIKELGVTHLYSVPILYYLMAKIPDIAKNLDRVESIISGGYKLTERIFQYFKNKSARDIREGYGLTEASPICTWQYSDRSVIPGSVGRSLPCCRVAVMNGDDSECVANEVGEVCVRGENVMRGYYRHPELTRKTLRNGWLHTGDLGRLDKDGYLYLVGLAKHMLNVGGRNVYPREVERLIRRNPSVRFIEIYGEPSELQGNIVRARVVLERDTPRERRAFKKWCLGNISSYKMPRIIHYLD